MRYCGVKFKNLCGKISHYRHCCVDWLPVDDSMTAFIYSLVDSVGGKFGSSQSKSSPARSKMSRTTSYSKDLGHQYNTGLDYHKTSTVSMSSPVSHPHKEKTQNEARNAVHG